MARQPTPEERLQIEEALASGRKIEAIKIYREATGKDLKEAKEFSEAFSLGQTEWDAEQFAQPATLSQEQMMRIEEALASGHRIEAVKIYHEATGRGLKEAKEFIEAFVETQKERDPEGYAMISAGRERKGCGLMIFLGLSLITVLVWLAEWME